VLRVSHLPVCVRRAPGRARRASSRQHCPIQEERMNAFRAGLSSAILIGTLLLLQFRSTGEAVPIRNPLDTFPDAVAVWQGKEATIFDAEVLNILKVNDYLMRSYVDSAGRRVLLYVGYWQTQRKGAQIHSPKNCLAGSGWEPLEASLITISLPPPYGS